MCQNRQHRTSNSNRAELGENPMMVDPVKSGTGVDLNRSSLCPVSTAICMVCVTHIRASHPIKKFRRTLSVAEQWALSGAR